MPRLTGQDLQPIRQEYVQSSGSVMEIPFITLSTTSSTYCNLDISYIVLRPPDSCNSAQLRHVKETSQLHCAQQIIFDQGMQRCHIASTTRWL